MEVEYKYNKVDWMVEVWIGEKIIGTYNYDRSGKNTKAVYGNGTENQYQYDEIGRLIRQTVLGKYKEDGDEVTGAIFEENYFYDRANNRIKMIDIEGKKTIYTYDKNYQLTGIDYSSNE